MRLILTILLIGLWRADAQMVINASAPYRPTASNLLLDDYSGAMVAFSLRKLDKDYTGSAIRVRKDTTGQPEQDIGFTANGDLDTASLKSFLNARSGFVTTWYNQADSSGTFGIRNATQVTANAQPRIALFGVIDRQGSNPTLVFSGGQLFAVAQFTYSAEFSKYLIHKKTSTNNAAVNITSTGGNVPAIVNHWIDGVIYFHYFRSGAAYYRTFSFNNNNFNLLEGYNSSSARSLYANNTLRTLGSEISLTGTTNTYNSIGRYSTTNSNGTCSEILLFNTDHSGNRTNIVSNINTYYSIY